MTESADHLRSRAEDASKGLPALLISAERLSSALVLGAHGLRRAGTGDEFWQYRPAASGDTARVIDWRRSARSDAQFVRDREAQIAQSAGLWVARGQGMDYSGNPSRPTKRARADLLALALGMALLRGGERVGLLGQVARSGRMQADRLAQDLVRATAVSADDDTPNPADLRPGQRVILLGDFLGDVEPVLDVMARAASLGVRGAILQILDPDEESFPFDGAVLFRSPSGAARHDTRDAGSLRAAYLARLAERREVLSRTALGTGWQFGTHDTASAPSTALLWLAAVLEG